VIGSLEGFYVIYEIKELGYIGYHLIGGCNSNSIDEIGIELGDIDPQVLADALEPQREDGTYRRRWVSARSIGVRSRGTQSKVK
jgi:hypothetical protein